ncbi:MAG: sterol desaturase family protein [Bacteroidia bacterium]|nr:sterol desaturase family protein [Bacteroidia bacterium]MDW8088146.1 sterol desaturase family protein [Bacteroidia bacterium]
MLGWRFWRTFLPPLAVYGAIISANLLWALRHYKWWLVVPVAVGGWVFWTLVEYLLHRFGFHEPPGKTTAQKYDIHWIHHRLPHDPTHIVTGLGLSLPLAAAFFGLFWLIGGGNPLIGAAYAGLGVGYLWYEFLHGLIHASPTPPWKFLRGLWRHHYWHHFRNPEKYYGVTTRWWDYLFGTA